MLIIESFIFAVIKIAKITDIYSRESRTLVKSLGGDFSINNAQNSINLGT